MDVQLCGCHVLMFRWFCEVVNGAWFYTPTKTCSCLFPAFLPSLLVSICLPTSITIYRTFKNVLNRERSSLHLLLQYEHLSDLRSGFRRLIFDLYGAGTFCTLVLVRFWSSFPFCNSYAFSWSEFDFLSALLYLGFILCLRFCVWILGFALNFCLFTICLWFFVSLWTGSPLTCFS